MAAIAPNNLGHALTIVGFKIVHHQTRDPQFQNLINELKDQYTYKQIKKALTHLKGRAVYRPLKQIMKRHYDRFNGTRF